MKIKFIIAGLTVILAVLVGILIVNRGKESNPTPTPAPPIETERQLATPEPSQDDVSESPTEQPTPTSQPDTTKTTEEVWEMVVNVLMAAEDFYKEYSWQTQYVSKNGYLFENASGDYITPAKLLELTEMRPEYAEETVWILFLRSNAFDNGAVSGQQEKELSIFTAYETSEGFAVAGPNIETILPKTRLDEVLAEYQWDHGQVMRYDAEDEQMKQILTILSEDDGNDLDIRHMARDDKYASAVVSPKNNSTLVKEYALVNENGSWSVALSDIEKQERKFTAITQALPDMSLDLVPGYQLSSDLIYMKTDFSDLLTALRTSGSLYESDGDPTFASGDSDFVYLEFATDLKLLGCYDSDQNQWIMYPVLHYADAESLMEKHAKYSNPPYFYIKEN